MLCFVGLLSAKGWSRSARAHELTRHTSPQTRSQVLSMMVSTKFLHREIREKNGAYGCVDWLRDMHMVGFWGG